MASSANTIAPSQRIGLFDVLRGFSVVSMTAFHFCYDYVNIAHMQLDWFKPPFQDIWRASISWTFLFIAGCMCAQSRSNFRRGGIYAAAALALFVVTSIASVDAPISFGIIFCMAASTLLYALLQKIELQPRGFASALVLFVLFLVTLKVPRGLIGIGPLQAPLPQALYSSPLFSWLGLPGPGFVSSDYYPLIPYTLLYLCGASCANVWHSRGYPSSVVNFKLQPLTWIGQHALLIYILHQPVILAILALLGLI